MTKLWEQVRRARKNFLQALAINFQCPAYDPSLLNDIDIEMNFNKTFSGKFQKYRSVSDEPLENVTEEYLKEAVTMFTYLTYCPPNLVPMFKKIFNGNHTQIVFAFRTELLKDQKKERVRATLE